MSEQKTNILENQTERKSERHHTAFNVAVLISGNGTNLQALIDAQQSVGYSIKLVVSSSQGAYGLTRAKQADIPCGVFKLSDYESKQDRDLAIVELCKKLKINLVVCAGYLAILTDCFFDPKNKFDIINIHPSLLPKHGGKGMYGIKVHQAVLASGDTQSGATVHYVTQEVDKGKIIIQKSLDIHPSWQDTKLQQEIFAIEHEIIVQAVAKLMDENRQM